VLNFVITFDEKKLKMNYVEKQTTHINHLTGEVLKNQTFIAREEKLPSEPAYIKLYTDDLGNLYDLSPLAKNVLLKLMTMTDYEGEILLPKGKREQFATELKTTIGSINNAITEILKSGLISRDGSRNSGVYILNPTYMAKGKWRDIYKKRQSFKITITYKDKGKAGSREIVTEQLGADVVQLHPESETDLN
jgi:predicted transcriptional regulator